MSPSHLVMVFFSHTQISSVTCTNPPHSPSMSKRAHHACVDRATPLTEHHSGKLTRNSNKRGPELGGHLDENIEMFSEVFFCQKIHVHGRLPKSWSLKRGGPQECIHFHENMTVSD